MQIGNTTFSIVSVLLFLNIVVYSAGQNGNFRNLFNANEFKGNRFSNFRPPNALQQRAIERRRNILSSISGNNIPLFLRESVPWAYANSNSGGNIPEIIPQTTRQPSIRTTTRPKQYNQKGKVFGYCDIGNDDDLDKLFPGVFQSEPEILSESKDVIKKERWYGNSMRTYGQKKTQVIPKSTSTTTPESVAHVNNQTVIRDVRPAPSLTHRPVCHCCQTNSRHEVYRNITIDDKTYDVIQLPGKFQAIPVGTCPEVNLCLHGKCVQHYNVHNVLIWNSSVPYWPAFDFALVEHPSYCTWENVGQ